MRTRKEIEKDRSEIGTPYRHLYLELLLDIREILERIVKGYLGS